MFMNIVLKLILKRKTNKENETNETKTKKRIGRWLNDSKWNNKIILINIYNEDIKAYNFKQKNV
jgi:hypothetical protein